MILHSKPTDSRGEVRIGFYNFSKKGVDTPLEEKKEEEEFIKEEEFKV